ncbi:hypothetical protein CYLTODRAFT_208230 [Cylindrobasidium torrendii FP15055 ss-10]|uniref:Arrestin-like N-terminal domain-containing protein n=1 Tax=Cylindrobasidium torrendii FP15055 ss-10 TaxID=1314674 RepID=A0A0D7AU29_9AGAR|nr:hypothetical protein CYLTODRAFT_208230 [Cylindrobasidium torrendii FP15055 ss-10]
MSDDARAQPPSYSTRLRDGEARLEHSPSRSRRSSASTDTWMKTQGHVTLALAEQDRSLAQPVYGRTGRIHGAVLLDDRSSVGSVKLQLVGFIRSANPRGQQREIPLLNMGLDIWPAPEQQDPVCPGALTFSFRIPDGFFDHNLKGAAPLPPSYSSVKDDFELTVGYELIINVEHKRGRALGMFNRSVRICVPIIHKPATRPVRPLLQHPVFFSSVKVSPEEWKQTVVPMNTKTEGSGPAVDPVNCSLFIPALQVFAVTDKIPVHVQITGTLTSLVLLFPSPGPRPPSPSDSLRYLTLKLLRQVTVEIEGKEAYRNVVIGTGELRPVPPPAESSTPPNRHRGGQEHMDWEGQLKCESEDTVGSFSSVGCSVKDYIVFEVDPHPESPFSKTVVAMGCRIVTNPWTEEV